MKVPLIFFLLVLPVEAQTATEIQQVYGDPAPAYSVTEHIWMTADFAADGQVCSMRFEPKRVDHTVHPDKYLNFQELKWILNQIVPPSARGQKKQLFGSSMLGGGSATTEYGYEKVTFLFGSTFTFHLTAEDLEKSELVGLDFPVNEPYVPPKPPPPSDSDFDNAIDPEVVVLRWNDRKCGQSNASNP